MQVIRDTAGKVTVDSSAPGISIHLESGPDHPVTFTDSYVEPAPVEDQAPAAPAPPSQPAEAAADAEPAPATGAGSEAPAAADAAAPAAPYKCPLCGAGYDGPGTCSNQHPPAEVLPTDQVVNAPAAEAAPPAWPDAAGSAEPS